MKVFYVDDSSEYTTVDFIIFKITPCAELIPEDYSHTLTIIKESHTYRYEGVICYPLFDCSNNLVSSSLKEHA